ncbi:GtrA family protein [Weissella confusa]|uniref:GtrA family protein n=1 Tax=Weissella fermenti TaxID=2987699 RepID=A0ABT6D3H3_9LACO|nr:MULTISPECIES: GtrA family protein [Weissella]MBJ7687396.1 GtrA family protein [Weissella confusa]MCW0927616.1 GtrA family protein [Weissella sp. LMG 11983]MDF9300069.1 GtrA family protein [Weissella sp. BK2]
MVEMVKDLLVKFRSQILYLFFGVLTTVVNIVVYALLRMTDMPVQVSYWLAWFITVLVAYLTNRKWVFKSQASTPREYFDEIVKFYVARLATGVIGSGIMWIGVSWLHQNDMLWNIIQNVFVIVSNYVLSKLVIFKAKQEFEN